MKLFLFTDGQNEFETEMAKRLDREFIFMVDSVHGDDRVWLEKNFSELPHQVYFGHRVYGESGKNRYVAESIKDVLDRYTPLLIVCFQVGDEITREDRIDLKNYFFKLLFDNGEEGVQVSEKVEGLLQRCRINYQQPMEGSSLVFAGDQILVKGSECYDFRYKLFPGFDLCLAEVVKPYTDRPYTVVLRNFEENGWRFLFSSLFYAKSWGLCHEDFLFLRELWDKLEMEGECDLEALLKEHCDRCTPGNKWGAVMCEPELYRKTLEEALEQLKRKKCHEIEVEEELDEVDKLVKKTRYETFWKGE